MVALRATGSNAEPETKAEKRRANSLTNTLPMHVPFGNGETGTPPMYYLFVCRIQQGRKGRCIQFAHINWKLDVRTNAERVLPPGLAKGIPSERGER